MFNRLKKAFSKFVESVVSTVKEDTLSEKDVNEVISNLYFDLIENDVAVEVADAVTEELKKRLIGVKVPRFGDKEAVVKKAVLDALMGVLSDVPDVDFYQDSKNRLETSRPVTVMFLGPNGYGKTTTLAKLAYHLQERGFRVVAAAADTFRAGAREQLEEHGRRVGFRVIGGPYGADPASVAYDAVQHARSKGFHYVLIDTAGRMHTDANLMEELRKIQRVVEPQYSIFVFDAQLGNEALEIARYYSKYVKIDGMIAAKVDAYPKGGSILTFLYTLKRPVYFLGVGQSYKDLVQFTKQEYVSQLLT
ncbi:MAG: signal recognition particle-docking protein FtsY [Pyrobaculum arsenaticum]|uniref:Signal recognition particle-docking protein FtsY n=2 Tax=Pyrobaculum arsenaticum TaxID=121277 RepID=A4WL92_PYRAR|nr:signal recognition particle-docking protein FtsY [Pyrobaculum arsenaticum]ABP51159.1 signal recognition particle-docking protein FtsY [Pyrobaculum arsenaticum DSM 13514]MCY0891605.1 signal recognition particle-docking protein FtsY [Pyrobaculum arsenaticum]NYR15117.1 signal recognition particle-docking protein FtsY [Pyrobaculum arsenaticum]